MPKDGLLRWTRAGILNYSWNLFESFEKLILSPQLRERLAQKIALFSSGKEHYADCRLAWRYGIFLFGPAGSGKTAASRGMARQMDWEHFTIPAHEILDSHLLERALFEAVAGSHRVIVMEDVDQT